MSNAGLLAALDSERYPEATAGLRRQMGTGVREGRGSMETYNIYMDELTTGADLDGEGGYEVQFRVTPNSTDEGDPENNAVLANLNLYDLIDLRDAIQQIIDDVAMQTLEEDETDDVEGIEEELMP
jgi:hypothetical protein